MRRRDDGCNINTRAACSRTKGDCNPNIHADSYFYTYANRYAYSQPTPKMKSAAEFASVSAGNSHGCKVRTDGTVTCWGSNKDWENREFLGQAKAPGGKFTIVSAGWSHT